ncbi:MAG: hypothetical protein KBT68_11745 [bacterium]|nr:hypothetical protein [Candidatus Colisoma equi]
MKRCPVAVRLALSICLTAFSLVSSGAAESVRRIGPFASARARLTRGEEYPGAAGDVVWTLPSDFGPVARCYDMMGNTMPVPENRTFTLTESPIYVVGQ